MKDNEIIIKDNTKISQGKFYIVILDSKNNIIAKKDELKDNENINFITPNNGEYHITSGNFNVTISASNNIDIFHKNFFD